MINPIRSNAAIRYCLRIRPTLNGSKPTAPTLQPHLVVSKSTAHEYRSFPLLLWSTREYGLNMHFNNYRNAVCDHRPFNAEMWALTVTAPEGVTHETLFDPADMGNGTRVGQLAVSEHVSLLLWHSQTGMIELETSAG